MIKKRKPDPEIRRELLMLMVEIRALMPAFNMKNPNQLAKKAGVAHQTADRMLSKKFKFPEYETVRKLSRAVNLTVEFHKTRIVARRTQDNKIVRFRRPA